MEYLTRNDNGWTPKGEGYHPNAYEVEIPELVYNQRDKVSRCRVLCLQESGGRQHWTRRNRLSKGGVLRVSGLVRERDADLVIHSTASSSDKLRCFFLFGMTGVLDLRLCMY